MQDNSALGRAIEVVRDLRKTVPLGPGPDSRDRCGPTWSRRSSNWTTPSTWTIRR